MNKIWVANRRTGKTTECIKLSAEKQIPMLVMHSEQKRMVMTMAEELELSIPEPVTALNYKKENHRGLDKSPKFIIDEVESILEALLDAKIEAMTVGLNDYQDSEVTFLNRRLMDYMNH